MASSDPKWQKNVDFAKLDQCGFTLWVGLMCRCMNIGTATLVTLGDAVLREKTLGDVP